MVQEKLILGRYRVMSDAGSGGFAAVKVAWDTTIQRKVAIKVIELSELDAMRALGPGSNGFRESTNSISLLDGEGSWRGERDEGLWRGEHGGFGGGAGDGGSYGNGDGDDDDAENFDGAHIEHSLANVPGLDEARTAAMLSDANIVTVYDFQIQGTTAYLIMEYVEGVTLSQLMKQVGDDLSLDVVAAVFSSVSHALEVAHRNQVLHLDIKPDNVLVNRQGQVKVTDFGLATLADASGCGFAGGGTIGYMPLEQMRQEALDARSDEWALASLTYEMLTGDNPFLAHTLEQAEDAIENAELVLPSLCWKDMDPAIDDVMFMALDPDIEDRYASVVDFAEDLEPLLGNAQAGHRELAEIMSVAADREAVVETPAARRPRKPHVPLVDRLDSRTVLVISRVVAVLSAGLVAAVALANIPLLAQLGAQVDVQSAAQAAAQADARAGAHAWGNPILWGMVLLVALAAAIRPHAGALAAFVLLAVSLFFNDAPVVAAILLVATAAWWFFSGRKGAAEADVVLAAPLFGAVGCAPIAPLAAGALLPLAQTAIAAGYSALLAIVFAGFGSDCLAGWFVWAHWDYSYMNVQANVIALVTEPATWMFVASWIISAVAYSAFCYRGSRAFDVAGSIVAAVVLVAGACIAGGLSADIAEGSPLWMQSFSYVFPACVAAATGILAAATGIPDRARWE